MLILHLNNRFNMLSIKKNKQLLLNLQQPEKLRQFIGVDKIALGPGLKKTLSLSATN